MKAINLRVLPAFALCATALLFAACGRQDGPATETQSDDAAMAAAKVPVTTSSETARDLYMQGRSLADDLHFVDANIAFAQAVKEDPAFAMGYAMLAQTSQTTAEFFAAVGKAHEHAAGASEGEQLIIRAVVAGSENNQAAQQDALTKLVAMYPKDERTHMRLATFLYGQQDFTGTIEHLKHANAINPNFAGAYNMLGYSNRSLENFDDAKVAFAKYVELLPDEANPYDSYAELLMEMGDYEESIVNYRKALDINQNFASAYIGIATNESLKGEADLAQEAAERGLAAARNFAERQGAMYSSVIAHLFAGNTGAAMAMCETILAEAEVKGNRAAMGGALEYMGDIMLAAGEPAKAEGYYDSALDNRLQAGFNEANLAQAERTHMFKTALVAMNAGDAEAAATRTAEYNAAAEMNGTAFEKRRVHELSAFLAQFNEELEAAAKHFDQASQLNPVVLYWSARTQAALGNTDRAIDLATRAANRNTLNPNLPFFRDDALALLAELNAE